MKTGDFVTGIPASERFREEDAEWVAGTLEIVDVEFGSSSWKTYLINVKYTDGSDVPVSVLEDSIVETDPSTVETTVLELPEGYSGD